MYSSLKEVWECDPVKEITKKINNGDFISNSEYSESFNFKKHNNKKNKKRIQNEISLSDVEYSYPVKNIKWDNDIDEKIKKCIKEALDELKNDKYDKDDNETNTTLNLSKEMIIILLINVIIILFVIIIIR